MAVAVLFEEVGAFRRAPRDRAKAPAVLREGHLQVPLLDRPRPVDDLDTRRVKHRPRIGEAEGAEQVETAHQVVRDRAQRQRPVDPEPRPELIGLDHLGRHRR